MKLPFTNQFQAVTNQFKKLGRHHYFIFIVLLLSGLVVAVYVVNQTLTAPSDKAYREQKIKESLSASFDRATIEKIENLQKSSETGTTPPPAQPGVRTNPFAE